MDDCVLCGESIESWDNYRKHWDNNVHDKCLLNFLIQSETGDTKYEYKTFTSLVIDLDDTVNEYAKELWIVDKIISVPDMLILCIMIREKVPAGVKQ